MNILGILGSPRSKGNTELLLDKVLEGAVSKGARTDKIILNNLDISPCQECENMDDTGGCIIRDEMAVVYEKIKKTDILILASPIFFGSLSAQTKIMIDRFQCAWRARYILKKDNGYKRIRSALLLVEGSKREDFFLNAESIAKNFFSIVNAEYKHKLFCPGVDDKGDILKHSDCIKKAIELGYEISSKG